MDTQTLVQFATDVIPSPVLPAIIRTLTIFIGVALIVPILMHRVARWLNKYVKKTRTNIDDLIVDTLGDISWFFYGTFALFVSVEHLHLPDVPWFFIQGIFFCAIVYEIIRITEIIITYTLSHRLFIGFHKNPKQVHVSGAIRLMIRIILWSVGIILILSNLGVNVTSLVASLGIGGLAISLALQNVFADIFSAFTIAIDKPFKEGDFVILGEHEGTVKKIGLKTTRIEALQGEEIVISNAELTSTRIRNYKKMRKRRIKFCLGVMYGTSGERLRIIPKLFEEIINSIDQVEFGWAHFKEFGDFSLNFELVYYIDDNSYKTYVAKQEEINLALIDKLDAHDIEIAFPTQTVHVIKKGDH